MLSEFLDWIRERWPPSIYGEPVPVAVALGSFVAVATFAVGVVFAFIAAPGSVWWRIGFCMQGLPLMICGGLLAILSLRSRVDIAYRLFGFACFGMIGVFGSALVYDQLTGR